MAFAEEADPGEGKTLRLAWGQAAGGLLLVGAQASRGRHSRELASSLGLDMWSGK